MGASNTLALTLDLLVFTKDLPPFCHKHLWKGLPAVRPNIRGARERCEPETSGSCSKSHMSERIWLITAGWAVLGLKVKVKRSQSCVVLDFTAPGRHFLQFPSFLIRADVSFNVLHLSVCYKSRSRCNNEHGFLMSPRPSLALEDEIMHSSREATWSLQVLKPGEKTGFGVQYGTWEEYVHCSCF